MKETTAAKKDGSFFEKHAEIWKFIKFTFAGASSSLIELGVFALLQYVVFKSLNDVPVTDSPVLAFLGIEYKGYMYSYFISTVVGYAIAYVMNRKITFKADANPLLSTVLYAIMVVCTIIFNTWFGAFLGTLIKNSGHSNALVELLTKVVVMAVPAESQASATLSVFKNLGRRFPAKTFSRTIVNKIDNIIYSLLRNCTKIETFRKEET